MVSTTPVQHGDFLILGSDGLFDNLRDEDIKRTVENHCSSILGAGIFSGTVVEETFGSRAPVPSPSQLQRTATALVDLAIASVKLDTSDGTTQMPWGSDGAEVPANNADDTTALVAFVQADPAARDAQDDLLGSCGVLAGSSSTGRLHAGWSPAAQPRESESLAQRAQQQCGGSYRGRGLVGRGTANGRSFSAGPAFYNSAYQHAEEAFRNGDGTFSPLAPMMMPGGRLDGGHDPHCELRTEECVIS
jgi:hypothetical protein